MKHERPAPSHNALSKKALPLIGLTAILLLAATLRFVNINELGYVNHYYAAAVKSMLQSWHNFFFAAAEPGGSVTVDKPPLGLWLQAISAYFLGVNSLGLLLPQILAGLASIVLVYHLVRRSFGPAAGLLAALTLAITPVVVATDRNNTIDSTMILTLLLAAWAFIKATEGDKSRFLMLGAVLVGVAFNIKMLAAFLPVPAFFALYFLGSHEGLWRKVIKLSLASILLLAVSFSWAIAVDLTPADQRPYVGSSSDNSEMTLIFGYNGINRLVGLNRNRSVAAVDQAPGPNLPRAGSRQNGIVPIPGIPPRAGGLANDGQMPPARPSLDGQTLPAGPRGVAGQPDGNRPRGAGFNLGQAGVLRLFSRPLSKEASWLMPIGLSGMVLLLAASRLKWPLDAKHQALALWGGWLLTSGIFFSVASFFHEYYLSMLGAPLAALVGIGMVEIWKLRERRPWLAMLSILTLAGITLGFQIHTASSFVSSIPWLLPTMGIFLCGVILTAISQLNKAVSGFARIGVTLLAAAMFITPGIWSWNTALNPGGNLSLPAAYSGNAEGPANQGNTQVNINLLNYLETNTQDTTYLMAVPSSMQGADYVLATGRPVLYMGGFNGNDEVVNTEKLAQMVQGGELRYIYWSAQGNRNQSDTYAWISSACTPVKGFNTITRNAGAPDGTTGRANFPAAAQNGGQTLTLYDCRGQE